MSPSRLREGIGEGVSRRFPGQSLPQPLPQAGGEFDHPNRNKVPLPLGEGLGEGLSTSAGPDETHSSPSQRSSRQLTANFITLIASLFDTHPPTRLVA